MKPSAPWSLRWAFIWATLTGDVVSISYFSGTYRIDVHARKVRRWREQNERRNLKLAKAAAKEAGRG